MAEKFGNEATGNTKAVAYAVTTFEESEMLAFKELEAKYKVIGKEKCPKTGRTHWQCYINFKNARSFKALKKILPKAHIEKAKGNAKQNREYCIKDGEFEEYGELPEQGKKKLSAEELKNMSDAEIIEFDIRCHKAYINAREILKAPIKVGQWKKNVKVYYIQGPSGSGKSYDAEQIIMKHGYDEFNLVQFRNDFWMGTGDCKACIYDDWRPSDMRPSEFIKFIDYNIQMMNVKGGSRKNMYELIIITSVIPLKEIYVNYDDEPRKQWERRIELIEK